MTNYRGKRTVAVNVKMTEADFEALAAAARNLWPGAIMSNSSILLSLAKMGAEQARKPPRKRTAR